MYYMWMSFLTPELSSHLTTATTLCVCVCVRACVRVYAATCMLVQPVKLLTPQEVIVTPENPVRGIKR